MKREAAAYLAVGISAITASFGLLALVDYLRPPLEAEFTDATGATKKVLIDCQFDCPPPDGDETIMITISIVLALVGILLVITSIRKALK